MTKNMINKIIRTKQALRQALWSISRDKEIEEITVSELCRQANINRTTFYKYYSVPVDLINEYVEEICQHALYEITRNHDPKNEHDLYQIMLDTCHFYYRNQEIISMFVRNGKTILPIMQRFFANGLSNGLKDNSLSSYISGGVSAIILQWGLNGFKQSPEEIADLLTTYTYRLMS